MMATMKIGETSQNYASADFSFPVNPRVVNVPFTKNYENYAIPFSQFHTIVSGDGVATRRIILTGELFGSSKKTDFDNLSAEILDNNVKRFWVSDSVFYEVVGADIRHTLQGGRTNFIDYVVALDCVTPYALDTSNSRQYTVALTTANKTTLNDSTSGSSGAFTNSGTAPALVKWTIENATGSAITKIEIGDSSDYDSSAHKVEWSGSLASGSTLILNVWSFPTESTRGTIKQLRFVYPTVSGTKSGNARMIGNGMPWIDAGTTNQDFSIKLTGNSDTANITADWYDSFVG